MPEGAEGVGGVTDEAAVVEVDGGLDVGLEGVAHGDDVAAEAADFAPPLGEREGVGVFGNAVFDEGGQGVDAVLNGADLEGWVVEEVLSSRDVGIPTGGNERA